MTYGQKQFEDINSLLNSRIERKGHLIAVHRGSWGGNIIQNTIASYICALKMGADMVECDVNSSTDGVLFSFHDGYEPYLLGVDKSIKKMSSAEILENHPINTTGKRSPKPIDTFSDILEWLPEGVLLNIDRCWDIFPQVLSEMDRHKSSLRQTVLKAPVKGEFHGVPVENALKALEEHPVKYMFMPICYSLEDVDAILARPEINTVGCELIARKETDELYSDEAISYIHSKGLYCWVNAIQLGSWNRDGLYGKLDDDISVLTDPDLGWGRLFDKKIEILQTDWPAILRDYRTARENR